MDRGRPSHAARMAALAWFCVIAAACSLDSTGSGPKPGLSDRDAALDASDLDANDDGAVSLPPPEDAGPDDNGPTPESNCNGDDDDSDTLIDEGACPCRSENWGGHNYLFCDTNQKFWQDGRFDCQANAGYDLAAINSEAENDWLADKAPPEGFEHGWWIGMYREATPPFQAPPPYKWVTNEAVTFTSWYTGEPSYGSVVTPERCVEFNFRRMGTPYGQWNDRGCLGEGVQLARGWICESK